MFAIFKIFETLFAHSTCLEDVRRFLDYKCINKYCTTYINLILNDCMRVLVNNIRQDFFANPSVVMSTDETQEFLLCVHKFGKELHFLSDQMCIVAGSFALSFYTLLRFGDAFFQPSDIDVYHNYCCDISSKFEGYDIEEEQTSSYGFAQNVMKRDKVRILTHLKRRYKMYNWDRLLSNMHTRVSMKSYIKTVSVGRKKNRLDVNLISTCAPFHCGTIAFADHIFAQFDMAQCCVAIHNVDGTFYPKFCASSNCTTAIEKRCIEFTQFGAFFDIKKQMQRVRKYLKRGFGLETNPEIVQRLT